MKMNQLIEKLDNLIGQSLRPSDPRGKDDGKYGRALEEYLGVPENNDKKSDLVLDDGRSYELKTSDKKSNQTLFNQKPSLYTEGLELEGSRSILDRYPSTMKEEEKLKKPNRKCFNVDMKVGKFNKRGWKLTKSEHYISAEHSVDGVVMKWGLEDLKKRAFDKLDKKIDVFHKDGVVTGYDIKEGFSFDRFLDLVESGDINLSVKLRYDPDSKPIFKDRGMGFRIKVKKLKEIYNKEEK